jgi:hypothetical protein
MATTYKKLEAPVQTYITNPSIVELDSAIVTKNQRHFLKNGNKALVIDEGSGEHMGKMGAVFIEEKVVDTEQFIKIFASGIEELTSLSGAGLKVFKLIYQMMLDSPNNDVFTLDFNTLKTLEKWTYSKPTFSTGMNELLTREIIYKSIAPAQYFLNIKLFYNGNRVTKIQSYRIKSSPSTDLLSELDEDSIKLLT